MNMMSLIVSMLIIITVIAIFFYCRKSHDYEPIISIVVIGAIAVILYEVMKLYWFNKKRIRGMGLSFRDSPFLKLHFFINIL